MSPIDPLLLQAYRDTDYIVVHGGEELVLRIGEHSEAARKLLAAVGVGTGALLTAWNPRSQPCSEETNQRAHARLRLRLQRLGLRTLPAEGRDPTGAWPAEASAFVLGITRQQADRLAREFEQNAWVWLEVKSGRPELVVPESPENAWEALCLHASTHNWCWDVHCTTCGATELRVGLHRIAQGMNPQQPGWPDRDALLDGRGEPWTEGEYRYFAALVAASDFDWIRRHCSRPDWLGYIGIALSELAQFETSQAALTKAWVPEFLRRLPAESRSRPRLERLADASQPAGISTAQVLRWTDLESLEFEL